MMRLFSCLLLAAGLSATVSTAQHSHDSQHGEVSGNARPLKDIMADLGLAMTHLLEAVMKEDLKAVARAARLVADHPTVLPEEMKKISTALGKDMARFKAHDMQVHTAATALAAAAEAANMADIVRQHSLVMDGCVACHSQFRKKVQTALAR